MTDQELESVESCYWTEDTNIIADVIGRKPTIELMKELGGASYYIPKYRATDETIYKFYLENGKNIRHTCIQFNLTKRMISAIIRQEKAKHEIKTSLESDL